MNIPGLSIDVRGRWTARQANVVEKALEDELDARGLYLRVIDVTAMQDEVSWFVFLFCCKKHRYPIVEDSACAICIRNAPVMVRFSPARWLEFHELNRRVYAGDYDFLYENHPKTPES